MARVYLKGLPQLKAKLKRLKEDTADDIRPVMAAAADMIVTDMRSYAPVDQGDLRESIGWTWGDAPRGSFSTSAQIGSNRITIFAGNEKAFYARWVEFGTGPRENAGLFAGTTHPGTAPQPFFFPAYRANRKKVKKMMRDAIRAAVRKAVK